VTKAFTLFFSLLMVLSANLALASEISGHPLSDLIFSERSPFVASLTQQKEIPLIECTYPYRMADPSIYSLDLLRGEPMLPLSYTGIKVW